MGSFLTKSLVAKEPSGTYLKCKKGHIILFLDISRQLLLPVDKKTKLLVVAPKTLLNAALDFFQASCLRTPTEHRPCIKLRLLS